MKRLRIAPRKCAADAASSPLPSLSLQKKKKKKTKKKTKMAPPNGLGREDAKKINERKAAYSIPAELKPMAPTPWRYAQYSATVGTRP